MTCPTSSQPWHTCRAESTLSCGHPHRQTEQDMYAEMCHPSLNNKKITIKRSTMLKARYKCNHVPERRNFRKRSNVKSSICRQSRCSQLNMFTPRLFAARLPAGKFFGQKHQKCDDRPQQQQNTKHLQMLLYHSRFQVWKWTCQPHPIQFLKKQLLCLEFG